MSLALLFYACSAESKVDSMTAPEICDAYVDAFKACGWGDLDHYHEDACPYVQEDDTARELWGCLYVATHACDDEALSACYDGNVAG